MLAGVISRRGLLVGAVGAGAANLIGSSRAATSPRIVSLDYGLTETMLVLGASPVAMPDCPGWERWVVDPPLPTSVQNLGADQEINLELLASLKPDLILTTPYLDDVVPTLQRIAPCERFAIYQEGGAGPLSRAETVTRRIGALLEIPDRAEAYLADAHAQFEADKARLAAVPRAPLLIVDFLDPRHVRVYGGNSLWQDVLDRLDRSNAWHKPTTFWGFATVGVEELAAVASDTVLVTFDSMPADVLLTLERSPLWRNLPFVKGGRLVRLEPALVFGEVPSARRFSRLLTAKLREGSP